MQLILPLCRMAEAAPYMDEKVFACVNDREIQSFESFDDFNVLTFDWYDIHSGRTEASMIKIYIDDEDLFFFCEDDDSADRITKICHEIADISAPENDRVLCRFFTRLLKGNMAYLDRLESEINDSEAEILSGAAHGSLERIIAWRRELLRLKHYYEQLDFIFDEISENENGLLSPQSCARLEMLGRSTDRYLSKAQNLQEVITQLRDAYQSQLSIQQNDLMKLFTVVTTVFAPLTLLTGWYGMNFVYMPELHWEYGYAAVIVAAMTITAGLLWFFRHKKWI